MVEVDQMSILTTLPPKLYAKDAFLGTNPSPAFSIGNARAAAWLCQLAYEVPDRGKMADILQTWGAEFLREGIISTIVSTPLPISRTEAFLAKHDGAVYLAFAGTDPVIVADWITDLRFHPDAMGIASGFSEAARSTLPTIKNMLGTASSTPLCVTGHSLGGALAVVAAAALKSEGFEVASVYTFGAPRPGTASYKKAYDAVLGSTTYRLVHAADIVPTVAPSQLGMRHVGRLLRCEAGRKFEPAMLAPDVTSDEPVFTETLTNAVRDELRQPWERPARFLDAARHLLDPDAPREENARVDIVSLVIETLPTAVRDHLPDRYIAALS